VRFALVAIWLAVSLPLLAQSPGAGMAESIRQQIQSIRLQAGITADTADSFFALPWEPLSPAASGAGADCRPISPAEVDNYVQAAAKREGFTPDLLRAVIGRESGFQPCVVSSKGAQGLMQLMPTTAAELGVTDPFDPQENIDGGARYLGEMLTRYGGDLELALSAYNAGPAQVDHYKGIPPIPETINYVANIMKGLKEVEVHD
jgi:soluble lytic murein transglycosylase-like protein